MGKNFDSLAVQDEEDAYFDTEDPAECSSNCPSDQEDKKIDDDEDDFMTMDLSKF